MPAETGDITRLLNEWRSGSRDAENQLFELVMPNLHRLANYLMRTERTDISLQPTELVNQVYLRLVNAKNRDWRNRQHFFAIAARIMRRYLIDHARGRPKADFIPLGGIEDLLPAGSPKTELALTVDQLLDELAKVEPAWCQVVEVKYFLGLTDEEAAEAFGLKLRTMQRMWREARRWLFERVEARHANRTSE